MLNIINHQRNANQNSEEILLHTCQDGCYQKYEITSVARVWEKGIPVHCWLECKLVQPLWKTVWRFLKKLKIELPNDPAILILGIYSKEMKSVYGRDICTPMFTAALFRIPKLWKQPKCPSLDEWRKKM